MGCWLALRALKILYFYFCKVIKNKKKIIERIFAKNFVRNMKKKIILGTSNRRLVNETIPSISY